MSEFNPENIPDELKERDQWVCWTEEKRNGKLTKIPKCPDSSGRNAKSNDMATWGSFEDATETAEHKDWGIGFMFSDAGPYVGVDLDGCLTEERLPADWLPSIDEFVRETYIEGSPSGDGLHLLFRDVRVPSWWANQKEGEGETERGVEVYDSGRFFTVTGDPIVHEGVGITDGGDLEGWLVEAWAMFNDELPEPYQSAKSDGAKSENVDLGVYDVIPRSSHPPDERSEHPFHSSETGSNFLANGDNETWRCWRHDCTGNAGHLLGIEQGIIECGEWISGGLDSSTWREIYDAGREAGYDIPEPPRTAPSTDGSEVVTAGEDEERKLPLPDELSVNNGGYGYWVERDDEPDAWKSKTNFQLETNSFATDPDDPNVKQIDMTVHPAVGDSYDVIVEPTVFNEKRDFKNNVVIGLTTSFSGGETVLNHLRSFVGTQDAPERIGTYQMGLHGDEWVTPKGVFDANGWKTDPEHIHVSRDVGAERKWSLSPDDGSDYDEEEVRRILELLPQTRDIERLLPAIGWFYATPFKPLIHEWTGQFNLLGVLGETGAGKSATLATLWELFGMAGDPMTADDTKYVLLTTLASTNAVPMWFDEYKPSDMSDWAVDTFWNEVRKTTRGGVSSRGKPDGSTEEFHLSAPVVVSGEERVHGSAEERRGIYTTFRKGPTDAGSDTARAFAQLIGGSSKQTDDENEHDDEIEYFDGCDLSQHSIAYYRFALALDTAEVRDAWRGAAKHVSQLLADNDIEGLEDLVEQGLQTIKFGATLYRYFVDSIDGDGDTITEEEIDEAILYIATNAIGGVNRKSHLDVLFEVAGRAARHDYLEKDTHYKFVREGEADEELRLNLATSFDKLARYAREHDVAEDLLNSKDDYRERINDVLGDGYVANHSIPTAPIGRSVGIYVHHATEDIDGFDKSLFTSGEGDTEAEEKPPEQLATPLRDLDPGYHDVTVRCVASNTDTPDSIGETGTLADASGVVDYIVWSRADPVELEEDGAYLIEKVRVGHDPDGAVQIELDGKICEISQIGDGVGNLSYADSENNSQIDTVADGGYDQAKPRMKELLREHGPCSKPEWMAKAQQANIERDNAEGAFESLKAQGQVSGLDDEWEVV